MLKYMRHCKAPKLMKVKSIFDLIAYIQQKPLQKKNYIAVAKKFKFTDDQSARIMEVSLRTFRKMTRESNLSLAGTEMVVRLSELYETGIDTCGNAHSFISWLDSSSISLGDHKPMWLIESGMGVEFVKDELLRMKYGMHS
jgi:putative toxin-antitoxin system antitoxin component (TIGR02293 family)